MSGQTVVPNTSSGLTLRAVFIGLLLLYIWIFIVSSWAVGGETNPQQVVMVIGFGAIFTLFFLQLFLHFLPINFRLRPQELVVIYAMVLVGIPMAITARGTMESVVHLRFEEFNLVRWLPRLPEWKIFGPLAGKVFWAPMSREALDGYQEGLAKVPWRDWWMPMVFWSSLILIFQFLMICTFSLFRHTWVEEEKLPFPLTVLPLQIISSTENRERQRAFFRSKWLWLAFIIGVAFNFPGIFSLFSGSIQDAKPALPAPTLFGANLTNLNLIPGFDFYLYAGPFVILALIFLPLDVLLTAFSFYLLFRAGVPWVGNAIGYPAGDLPNELCRSVARIGGILGLCIWPIFFHRRYFLSLFKRLFSGGGERQPGVISSRALLAASWIFFILFLIFLLPGLTGKFVGILLITLAVIFVYNFGYARLRAQAGYDHFDPYNTARVQSYLTHWTYETLGGEGAGTWNTGPGWIAHGHSWHFGSITRGIGPHMYLLGLYRLASLTRTHSKDIFKAVALTLILTTLIAAPLYLTFIYRYGYAANAPQEHWSNNTTWVYFSYRFGGSDAKRPTAFQKYKLYIWPVIGAAVVGLMMYLRREYVWFPLHPVGFVLAGCLGGRTAFRMESIWFSFLLAYLIKRTIFKWFGVKAFYDKVMPVLTFMAMGMLLGMVIYMLFFAHLGVGILSWH